MARLIRTEKEVEGRYEEVWLVVEEDALEQWPAGPREIVGRDAPRKTGPMRARGEARYTADIRLPGMLHAAVLRSPHAHARVKKISFDKALGAPGVRAAVGPGEVDVLTAEPGFQGQAVAAVAADTIEQAQAALDARRRRVGSARAAARSRTRRSDATSSSASRATTSGATSNGRSRRRTSSSKRSTGRRPSSTTRMETHQSICEWRGDTLDVYISTQSIFGVRDEVAGKLGLPPDKVRVVCEFMGGGFGSKNGANDHTFIAAELAKRTGRPVRCALTRREENLAAGNRNADDPAADRSGEVRRDARRARRRVRERNRVVRLGLVDRRPDADALRLRERPYRRSTRPSSIRRR